MSEYLTIDSVKNALVECPICTEYFQTEVRVPRRMPCCNQTICELCLELYCRGRESITCPLCCQDVDVSEGVKSLPREMVVLRFLDLLENQNNFFPSCTKCGGTAIAKCDTCRSLLCSLCLKAHRVDPDSEDHSTITFEKAKEDQQTRRKTVRQISEQPRSLESGSFADAGAYSDRIDQLGDRIDDLCNIHEDLLKSEAVAEEQINLLFDDLMQDLQQRRKDLLTELKTWSETETKEVKLALDAHQVLQFRLQKASNSRRTSTAHLIEEKPHDVDYSRRGVSFLANNVQQLSSAIPEVGVLRAVTFNPAERPRDLDDASHCSDIKISPAQVPNSSVTALDQKINLNNNDKVSVICPSLDFDANSAGENLTLTGNVVTNTKPEDPLPQTCCRLQAPRTVLVSRPLIAENYSRIMFTVKLNYLLLEKIPIRKSIAELAITRSPVDMNFSQVRGLSISLASCHFHSKHKKDLCLVVETHVDRICCQPVVVNKRGEQGELLIAVLLDFSQKVISVLDASLKTVLASTKNILMDEPLWTVMYLGRPEWTDISFELVSGQNVEMDNGLKEVIQKV